MSKIFNFIIQDGNQMKHVYIFVGELNIKDTDDLGSMNIEYPKDLWNTIVSNNIPYTIIRKQIYEDDSILRIKEKFVQWTNLNVSIPELYFFSLFNKKINSKIIFNQLTQDGFIELNNNRLQVFLKNINFSNLLEQPKEDDFFINRKSLYNYSDFISLKNISFSNENIVKKALGVDAFYNKKHLFISNPYESNINDDVLKNELASILTQNKKSLFEYGDCLNNSIYVCLASDVLNKAINNDEYLLKVYYPQLYNNYYVKNKDDIQKKNQKSLIRKIKDYKI